MYKLYKECSAVSAQRLFPFALPTEASMAGAEMAPDTSTLLEGRSGSGAHGDCQHLVCIVPSTCRTLDGRLHPETVVCLSVCLHSAVSKWVTSSIQTHHTQNTYNYAQWFKFIHSMPVGPNLHRDLVMVSHMSCIWICIWNPVTSYLWPIYDIKKTKEWGFPGGPVVKALHFPCRECGFDPWMGN